MPGNLEDLPACNRNGIQTNELVAMILNGLSADYRVNLMSYHMISADVKSRTILRTAHTSVEQDDYQTSDEKRKLVASQ